MKCNERFKPNCEAGPKHIKMSRSLVLLFLLLLMVFASQFEWKQQVGNEFEVNRIHPQKHYNSKQEEIVKEKIILSQEKKIQKLNELVGSLRKRLLQCRGENQGVNTTEASFVPYSRDEAAAILG